MTKDYRPDLDTPRNRGDYDAAHVSPVTPIEDWRSVLLNRVSLGAVFAGVVMALAVQIVLNLLGVGIGAVTIAQPTISASEFSMGAFVWWAAAGVIASYGGGFTAGRLSGEPKESTAGWHGLMSWATSVIIVALIMTTAAGTLLAGPYNVIAYDRTAGSTFQETAAAEPASAPANFGTSTYESMSYSSPDATAATGAPTDLVSGNTASTDTTVAAVRTDSSEEVASVSANTIATSALASAIALLLGAVAAWFGGRMGKIEPTVTQHYPTTGMPLQ